MRAAGDDADIPYIAVLIGMLLPASETPYPDADKNSRPWKDLRLAMVGAVKKAATRLPPADGGGGERDGGGGNEDGDGEGDAGGAEGPTDESGNEPKDGKCRVGGEPESQQVEGSSKTGEKRKRGQSDAPSGTVEAREDETDSAMKFAKRNGSGEGRSLSVSIQALADAVNASSPVVRARALWCAEPLKVHLG